MTKAQEKSGPHILGYTCRGFPYVEYHAVLEKATFPSILLQVNRENVDGVGTNLTCIS